VQHFVGTAGAEVLFDYARFIESTSDLNATPWMETVWH
jgi:hypothetical protein